MKIVVGTFMTLDGVIQAPGDSKEDEAEGFKHGGWQMPLFDEESGRIMDDSMARTEALLLGRKTYEIFANFWPNQPADDPNAAKLNGLPKYVVSTKLKKAEWNNSTLINKNVREEIARLKEKPGEGIISVVGSGKLAQSLMEYGLIDEYELWIYPLVLGEGKRLFEKGVVPADLKLTESRTTPGGAVILNYKPR